MKLLFHFIQLAGQIIALVKYISQDSCEHSANEN